MYICVHIFLSGNMGHFKCDYLDIPCIWEACGVFTIPGVLIERVPAEFHSNSHGSETSSHSLSLLQTQGGSNFWLFLFFFFGVCVCV